jgi:glyoxylase-like metal-dependent hydrolase (beta-lactamase superfamily II)
MRVHHVSCGTLCPIGGQLFPRVFPRRVVCHCLIVETAAGLVLVDTGLGERDLAAPLGRLGAVSLLLRPQTDPTQSATSRIRALGLSPADVRNVIVTHLDLDHAGGLPDFPDATVHVLRAERDAATRPALRERARYRAAHFAHGPRWHVHEPAAGEPWFGFEAVRALPGLPPEILLVPLPGHSRGHTGVAVETPEGWVLHAGDAYYDHRQMEGGDPVLAVRAFEAIVHHDHALARENVARLRRLREEQGDRVRVFCAHDPTELT